jgi:hypothetical protein
MHAIGAQKSTKHSALSQNQRRKARRYHNIDKISSENRCVSESLVGSQTHLWKKIAENGCLFGYPKSKRTVN